MAISSCYTDDMQEKHGFQMKILFRSLMLTGIFFELVIVLTSVIGGGFPLQVVTFPLVLILVALGLLFSGMIRDRSACDSWASSLSKTARRFGVPRRALVLLVSEIYSITSFARVFNRVKPVQVGEIHTGYKNLRTVVFLIVGLVVVEIVVVHLAITSEIWRIVLFVSSLYALVLLLGFYTSIRMNPHVVESDSLKIRHGIRFSCVIPWEQVRSLKGVGAGQGGDIFVNEDNELRVPVLSEVNLRLELHSPVVIEDLYFGEAEITAVDFYCDDKKALLDSAKQVLDQ